MRPQTFVRCNLNSSMAFSEKTETQSKNSPKTVLNTPLYIHFCLRSSCPPAVMHSHFFNLQFIRHQQKGYHQTSYSTTCIMVLLLRDDEINYSLAGRVLLNMSTEQNGYLGMCIENKLTDKNGEGFSRCTVAVVEAINEPHNVRPTTNAILTQLSTTSYLKKYLQPLRRRESF